jgi:hypothetical protein
MATIGTQSSAVKASKLVTEMKDMDAGVLKDIPAKTSLTINGAAMTQAQIDAQLKSYLGTFVAADTAKSQYQTALVARRNASVSARDFYLQLKKAVVAFFGTQAAQLADFGLTPAKAKAPRTAAEIALSAAKAKLTRAARGTTSKKKKAAITPGTASPAMAIGVVANAVGQTVTPPSVQNAPLPGSASNTATSTAGSTPQSSAGSSTSTPVGPSSAGTAPAGSTSTTPA